MKKFKVAKKPYTIEEDCPNCKAKGYIEIEVFDEYSQANKKLAYICPQCNNTKKIKKEEGERYEVEEVEALGDCQFEDGKVFVIEAMPTGGSSNSIFLEDGSVFSLEKVSINTYFDSDTEAKEHIENLKSKEVEVETDN